MSGRLLGSKSCMPCAERMQTAMSVSTSVFEQCIESLTHGECKELKALAHFVTYKPAAVAKSCCHQLTERAITTLLVSDEK